MIGTSHHATVIILIITTIVPLLLVTAHAIPRRPSTEGATNSLAGQFLAPQNAARAVAGTRPLVWDPELARYAAWWARQRRWDCALRHSDGPHGENIFWGSGTGWSPGQAVADWVSERRWYSYHSNTCSRGQMCGHYTQVVWNSTRRVGCAVEVCSNGGGTFMICDYDPPGNYIGERPY